MTPTTPRGRGLAGTWPAGRRSCRWSPSTTSWPVRPDRRQRRRVAPRWQVHLDHADRRAGRAGSGRSVTSHPCRATIGYAGAPLATEKGASMTQDYDATPGPGVGPDYGDRGAVRMHAAEPPSTAGPGRTTIADAVVAKIAVLPPRDPRHPLDEHRWQGPPSAAQQPASRPGDRLRTRGDRRRRAGPGHRRPRGRDLLRPEHRRGRRRRAQQRPSASRA